MSTLMNQDYEHQVVGAVQHDPSLINKLGLQAEHFGFIRPRCVWEHSVKVYHETGGIDFGLLIESMQNAESPEHGYASALDFVDGQAYVVKLTSFFELHDFRNRAKTYAEKIRDLHTRRSLANAADKIKMLARDTDTEIHEVRAKSRRLLEDANKGAVHHEPSISDTVDESDLYIYSEETEPGVTWMLQCLRTHLGVLLPGDFVVPSGRMKAGKTRFKVCQALHTLKQGKRVLVATTEMPPLQMFWLMIELQSKTGITITGIRNRTIRSNPEQMNEYAQLSEALRSYKNGNMLHILDARNHTAEMIYERVMSDDPGFWGLVVVDYIQRLRKSPGTWTRSDEEVGNRAYVLKNLAGDAETVVMSASQLHRNVVGRPSAANAADSDRIGREADYFLALQRNPEGENPNLVLIHIQEARFAPPITDLTAHFHPKNGSFHDTAPEAKNA